VAEFVCCGAFVDLVPCAHRDPFGSLGEAVISCCTRESAPCVGYKVDGRYQSQPTQRRQEAWLYDSYDTTCARCVMEWIDEHPRG
jgi:hypothetical protein